jgi:L-idonate 5-dehydrogenase
MRALVVHKAADLRLEERELDRTSGSVLVRPVYGGICGSDLHYYGEGRVGTFALQQPLILGHEVVAIVEHDPAWKFSAGDRVAVHPATPDGVCPECRAGRPNICRNGRYLGSAASMPHTQGAFAEQAVFRSEQLRRLPGTLPTLRAVLAEPLAVGVHAIARAGGVRDKRVFVSGAGPIGLLAAAAAVALGAAAVTVGDLIARPLEIARALGADATLVLGDVQPDNESFDVVLEAAGAAAALSTALAAAARGGVVVQIGMLPGEARPVSVAPLVSHEVDLRGTFRFDTELDTAIALLDAHPAFDAVITHRFALQDALTAFEVAADAAQSSKVVLDLSHAAA